MGSCNTRGDTMHLEQKQIRRVRHTQIREEAGFLTFSGILLMLVVAAILFTAFKLLTPYIDNYRLQDTLESIARNATYNRMSESDIRKEVMAEVRELDIPNIDDSDVKIQ